MTHVYIVFGAYYERDEKNILGVYSTVEAAVARTIASKHKENKGLDDVDYAYVYKATLDVDIDVDL